MKRVLIIQFFLFLSLAVSAQTADLHFSVLKNSRSKSDAIDWCIPVGSYTLVVHNSEPEYKIHFATQYEELVFRDVPCGKYLVEVIPDSLPGVSTLHFSDSLTFYPGTNAIFIEEDVSGSFVSIMSDYGAELSLMLGMNKTKEDLMKPDPYIVPRPSAPKVEHNNGSRRFVTNVFLECSARWTDAARDALLSFDGVSMDKSSYMIINNPQIKWSWKNGVLQFWEE